MSGSEERVGPGAWPSPSSAWQARWYLWDGGFFVLGRSSAVLPVHSHHAIQITIALDGEVGFRREDGDWVMGPCVAVSPDVPHAFNGNGAAYAMVFVDPESREGRWLTRSLREPITVAAPEKMAPWLPALRACLEEALDTPEAARLVHSVVRALCAGPAPHRALDPRVVRALEVIRQMDTARISLDEVARAVFLSPSRLAHLFSEEVGLPFRRYVLWRRLTRAMLAVGRGSTLSAAAHACGFSDSAHLTRTCSQMFGLAPSILMGRGEFYEIPAPFELPFPVA